MKNNPNFKKCTKSKLQEQQPKATA